MRAKFRLRLHREGLEGISGLGVGRVGAGAVRGAPAGPGAQRTLNMAIVQRRELGRPGPLCALLESDQVTLFKFQSGLEPRCAPHNHKAHRSSPIAGPPAIQLYIAT
eukprot:3392551-Prymnesium_polylepis.2